MSSLMGKWSAGCLLFALSCTCLGGIGIAAGQSATTPDTNLADRVLVVDIKAILQDSAAGKMVRSQIEQKRAEYTKEISLQEEDLRKERELLQSQQKSLSPATLNQSNGELQQKINRLDQDVQGKRQILEKSNGDALTVIQNAMLKIIADIAKAHKSTLVLQREDIVLFDQSYDVTDQALTELNKSLPAVTVNFAGAPSPPVGGTGPAQTINKQ